MLNIEDKTVFFRVDANSSIGSGHAMRCLSIAQQIEACGGKAIFVVSDEESLAFVRARGMTVTSIPEGIVPFSPEDGAGLAALTEEFGVSAVLVDSYAVSENFFAAFVASFDKRKLFYIDDLFDPRHGMLSAPHRWDVGGVVNYGFGAAERSYHSAYAGTGTLLYLGPRYAPIRPQFAFSEACIADDVCRVLVTCGSTNPGMTLEKMVEGCLDALPSAQMDVVVGSFATFDMYVPSQVAIHRGVTDMSPLMRQADLALSSAGSVLYELCAAGVPTVTVPIVENQMPNALGFERQSLGRVLSKDFSARDVKGAIIKIAGDRDGRLASAAMMQQAVDGEGTKRIAGLLLSVTIPDT